MKVESGINHALMMNEMAKSRKSKEVTGQISGEDTNGKFKNNMETAETDELYKNFGQQVSAMAKSKKDENFDLEERNFGAMVSALARDRYDSDTTTETETVVETEETPAPEETQVPADNIQAEIPAAETAETATDAGILEELVESLENPDQETT
ncbi:MAG: hypothetical protein P8Y20_12305 [Gammaproteobacteria bacterium]